MDLTERGRIIQINVKPMTQGERGIPKNFVESALVKHTGLEGDFNQHRTETGSSLDLAVLILTTDVISDLNKDGWPVKFGHLGENFTVHGVGYNFFETGKEYYFGREVIVKVSEPAIPCRNLKVLPYVGEEKRVEFAKKLTGRRGWYARVLEEGYVSAMDEVRRVL